MQGTVFNIERTSLYDGPGVRTVVFLKGCPLRCAWCHNPEGLLHTPQIMYNADRCIGCGACAAVCKSGARNGQGFDRTLCTACGMCARECCSGALSLAGEIMSEEQIIAVLRRDVRVFAASGGGLTVSGGEPLYQADFAISLATAAHAEGIHVCVETSGYGSTDKLAALAKVTDLFLFDCKLTEPQAFRTWCGGELQVVLRNLELLERHGAQIILRCPIIPAVNDTAAHIAGVAAWARTYSCIREIHIQPYHRLGISKSAQLGQSPMMQAQPLDPTTVADLAQQLHALCGKKVTVN